MAKSSSEDDDALLPVVGKYAELPLRILSALILAALVLYCTWAGGLVFRLFCSAAALLVFWEFWSMLALTLRRRFALFALAFLVLLLAAYGVGKPLTGIAFAAAGGLLLAAWEWVARRSLWGVTALVYSAAPFVALVGLRQGENGLFLILFVFACVWGADTFAYFTGKTLGGPKLAPAISPNKTWSGFLGGLAGAIIIAALLALAFGYATGGRMVALAVFLAFFSQIGDLFESWVKRRFGVKDSSRLIPGHGGLLDRIDGLIFAVFAAFMLGVYLSAGGMGDPEIASELSTRFFSPN